MKNYYDILGLPADADAQQIRQAYRKLSMQFHPDRHGGSRLYEERFKQINEAYQVLKDPVRRWQYRQDSQRRSSGPRPCGPWTTPDYSAQAQSTPRRPPRGRSFREPFQPYRGRKPDLGSTLWSLALLLVLVLPFKWAWQAPPPAAAEAWVDYGAAGYAQTVSYDFADALGERYRRDVSLLHELRKSDPGLSRLDMRTGYYEDGGRSIRLSWEILQLIREKNWKRQ